MAWIKIYCLGLKKTSMTVENLISNRFWLFFRLRQRLLRTWKCLSRYHSSPNTRKGLVRPESARILSNILRHWRPPEVMTAVRQSENDWREAAKLFWIKSPASRNARMKKEWNFFNSTGSLFIFSVVAGMLFRPHRVQRYGYRYAGDGVGNKDIHSAIHNIAAGLGEVPAMPIILGAAKWLGNDFKFMETLNHSIDVVNAKKFNSRSRPSNLAMTRCKSTNQSI